MSIRDQVLEALRQDKDTRSVVLAYVILFGLVCVFLVAFGYALLVGDFRHEGSILVSLPWGLMALVDLYMGFVLFAGFILVTETNRVSALIWISLLMVLGNLIAALYLVRLLSRHWSVE